MGEFTTLQGLDHLEGETVTVIDRGFFNGTYVVENGSITLKTAVVRGWVGLPYAARLRSLPMVGGLQGARSRNAARKIDNISVQYQASLGGTIGTPDREASFEPIVRRSFADNTDEAVPTKNGLGLKTLQGSSGSTQIEVRPSPGFPFKVLKMEARYVANP